MTQYKTEKRKARVGERILISEDGFSLGYYEIGDVLTVSSTAEKGVTSEDGYFILNHEYEVIIGEQAPAPNLDKMDYDELVALVEDAMKTIRTRSYKNGYEQGRFDAEIEATHGSYEKYDQQKRDEIVAKAKGDVRGLLVSDYGVTPKFIVNVEKRTVVCLRNDEGLGYILGRGIAKCAPDDCFNAHIGKAIALRRALGLEVPAEYLNVPQPTEVRVGDVVEYTNWAGTERKFTVKHIDNERVYGDRLFLYAHLDEASRFGFLATDPKTIDDSRAGGGE
ncbi:hypothetical protein [Bacillus safensis]|uniref:hypothetical protein n=1 Tax=Bacillus safensis TaxID=561879 RepID=UPI002FFD83D6